MQLLYPENFTDYSLLDCGDFLKLERFGPVITIRPEPQALWKPAMTLQQWRAKAHTEFVSRSASSGEWKKLKAIPEAWVMDYKPKGSEKGFRMRLALTAFKHVGIFPEQASNWDYIYSAVKELQQEGIAQARVLNLFAYTGGASLAARLAGADVTHLDSVRQVVSWARDNMELSALTDIRWLIEDAMTYVQREVKRGKKYHGIILDPPAYGHGTDGKKWKLEEMIGQMMEQVKLLLDEKSFLVLNTYSLGYSAMVAENLIKELWKGKSSIEFGELYLKSESEMNLPLGVFGRGKNY
ncbi:MAG TPA: class I SAM-dependent methyltransferase [Bacteroidia bacterium]|nr:class I SAM-dependent methyltransferase [Bacteroidia bacterium]